ncbi:MAG: peptidase M50 [Actinomycetota bacterium]|nr:peptidase M50 [Actinomycetota bacterium]
MPELPDVAVFGTGRVPRRLRALPVVDLDGVTGCRRVLVVGTAHELSVVLTRLLKADRLDVEVAHVRRRWHARRALTGPARRVPLIRDETGTVLTAVAYWLPPKDAQTVHGEAIVDDTVLFDGDAAGVRIEPLSSLPGLRARVVSPRRTRESTDALRPRRWVAGRAAQLGTTGATVVRDGEPAPRPVRRSTFYRHTQGWLRAGPGNRR